MQYVELPMSQKSVFYSGHSTELQAYSSAAKNLGKKGIDQSVDLDKAIGFTEQLERKIEETKEQLRETNSEEKKAQQERKMRQIVSTAGGMVDCMFVTSYN